MALGAPRTWPPSKGASTRREPGIEHCEPGLCQFVVHPSVVLTACSLEDRLRESGFRQSDMTGKLRTLIETTVKDRTCRLTWMEWAAMGPSFVQTAHDVRDRPKAKDKHLPCLWCRRRFCTSADFLKHLEARQVVARSRIHSSAHVPTHRHPGQ